MHFSHKVCTELRYEINEYIEKTIIIMNASTDHYYF